jgi:hypothetical protein
MAPILTNKLIIQPFLPPKTNLPPLIATTKIHPGLLITVLNHPTRSPPPYNPNTTNKTTRPIRNRDLDERRAKDLCFLCDEKFIPGHRCQNKKLYSLCIVEDNGEGSEEEGVTKVDPETYNHIYPSML